MLIKVRELFEKADVTPADLLPANKTTTSNMHARFLKTCYWQISNSLVLSMSTKIYFFLIFFVFGPKSRFTLFRDWQTPWGMS